MAELNEQVTVRQLPDGEAHSGRLESRERQLLRVSLPPSAKGTKFQSGAPVEVQSERVLSVGVILTDPARQNRTVQTR